MPTVFQVEELEWKPVLTDFRVPTLLTLPHTYLAPTSG